MPEVIDELARMRARLDEIRRSGVREMLWEDPDRACQPFWDVATLESAASGVAGVPDEELVVRLLLSAKPFVERAATRSWSW